MLLLDSEIEVLIFYNELYITVTMLGCSLLNIIKYTNIAS